MIKERTTNFDVSERQDDSQQTRGRDFDASRRVSSLIIMEGGESPLEVLSRAATMLQETQQHTMALTDDTSKQNSTKQLPTTKWKRDRRTRAEYLRKSDPKVPDGLLEQPDSPENSSSNQPQNGSSSQTNGHSNGNNAKSSDAPLDMSVRQRGLPPSYSQAISDLSFRSSYRPSVIANCVAARDEIPTGISMCDPIIDEHFRRSLGKDYNTVFSNNNVPKETTPPKPPQKISTNVIELMDSTGLSVDEHFAKALGDTWLKLNKKDTEIKNNSTENQSVVTI